MPLNDQVVQWAAPKLANTPGTRMEAVFIDRTVVQHVAQRLLLASSLVFPCSFLGIHRTKIIRKVPLIHGGFQGFPRLRNNSRKC